MHPESLFRRLFPASQTRAARRRGRRPLVVEARDRRRTMQVESLEARRVLAVLYVANDSGFTDAANPGSPKAGDAVTWNGGGQFTAPVSGHTFDTNAFDSINELRQRHVQRRTVGKHHRQRERRQPNHAGNAEQYTERRTRLSRWRQADDQQRPAWFLGKLDVYEHQAGQLLAH